MVSYDRKSRKSGGKLKDKQEQLPKRPKKGKLIREPTRNINEQKLNENNYNFESDSEWEKFRK